MYDFLLVVIRMLSVWCLHANLSPWSASFEDILVLTLCSGITVADTHVSNLWGLNWAAQFPLLKHDNQ